MAAASALDVVALGSACTGAASWPSACEGGQHESVHEQWSWGSGRLSTARAERPTWIAPWKAGMLSGPPHPLRLQGQSTQMQIPGRPRAAPGQGMAYPC